MRPNRTKPNRHTTTFHTNLLPKSGFGGRDHGQGVLHVRGGNGARRLLEVRPVLIDIDKDIDVDIYCCEKTTELRMLLVINWKTGMRCGGAVCVRAVPLNLLHTAEVEAAKRFENDTLHLSGHPGTPPWRLWSWTKVLSEPPPRIV